jgi:hypothetical protein
MDSPAELSYREVSFGLASILAIERSTQRSPVNYLVRGNGNGTIRRVWLDKTILFLTANFCGVYPEGEPKIAPWWPRRRYPEICTSDSALRWTSANLWIRSLLEAEVFFLPLVRQEMFLLGVGPQ